ncbi:MAG: TerB family tellurite resistance protein [Deltaproteobacteria bacterium]|nr:TerB family tellurite resistance protein [Deltaproteobacteria bacterium]MBW2072004.1 TerB family tellurite resistance protein [Deltaproteobacteria bacterium]
MLALIKKALESKKSAKRQPVADAYTANVQLATAALFIEMATIDGTFSQTEKSTIVDILSQHYSLSPAEVDSLLQQAKTQADKSTDLWHFTSNINKNYSRAERKNIVELLWRIVYSDGRLNKYEDYLIHKLANLLRLDHKELIDAKMKVLSEQKQSSS